MARKLGGSGRLRFALVLLGFVLTASVVVLRRTYGIAGARELQAMETKRSGLVAERRRLESEIRIESSRGHLQPIAEQRLQMHVPTEAQVVYLARDSAAATTHAKP
jgi:cell division protein FtsL